MGPQGAPFPTIPPRLAAAYDARGLRLRRFGTTAGDLDLDLAGVGRAGPRAITDLLRRCTVRADGGPLDPQFIWDLSVGKRLECLLVLAGLESAGQFAVTLVCPRESCRRPIEIDLSLDELLDT